MTFRSDPTTTLLARAAREARRARQLLELGLPLSALEAAREAIAAANLARIRIEMWGRMVAPRNVMH